MILRPTATVLTILLVIAASSIAVEPEPDSTLPGRRDYVPVLSMPELVAQAQPEYPPVAEEMHQEGWVRVEVLVDRTGGVRDAAIDISSGYPLLDEAALDVVPKCEFKPAVGWSRFAVACWTTVAFEFTLPEAPPDPSKPSHERFSIVLIRETGVDKVNKLPKGHMVVDGGFVHGLDSGMIGSISQDNLYKGHVPIADVEITHVNGMEARCKFVMRDQETIVKPSDFARFRVAEPSASVILERALAVHAEGDYEHAMTYFDHIWCLTRDNPFVKQLADQCQEYLTSRKTADIPDIQLRRERRRANDYLSVAKKYLEWGEPFRAQRHIEHVLLVDSTNAIALRMKDTLPHIDFYADKTNLCNRLDSIRAGTALPEIDENFPLDFGAKLLEYVEPESVKSRDYPFGTTTMKILIDHTGAILDVRLHKSSGHEQLDYVALEAAPKWKFQPAMLDGQPITSWLTFRLDFVL